MKYHYTNILFSPPLIYREAAVYDAATWRHMALYKKVKQEILKCFTLIVEHLQNQRIPKTVQALSLLFYFTKYHQRNIQHLHIDIFIIFIINNIYSQGKFFRRLQEIGLPVLFLSSTVRMYMHLSGYTSLNTKSMKSGALYFQYSVLKYVTCI